LAKDSIKSSKLGNFKFNKEYTKRQQIIYLLIHHLHDREGWETMVWI